MSQVEEEEDFGAMFEASLNKKRRYVHPGEKVSGTVMQVGEKRVIVDLGDGMDGMMELSELAPPGEKPDLKVGDTLEGFVLRADERTVEMVKAGGKGHAAGRAVVEDAYANRLPVDGMVSEVNKGGYVVEISGVRCFCPLGQMDVRRIEDPATMVGKKLAFRVTEIKGRDAVLSRRAVLEAENAERAAVTRASLTVGARLTGRVVNVRDFGAFVDLGGLEGLVPASELAHGRAHPRDVVSVGQDVEVEVLRMEPGTGGKGERITLSMRALVDHPFASVGAALQPGTVVAGQVTRTQPFGAFVELVPGVEGLIHVSAFGRRVNHPGDVVKPQTMVAVRVLEVDEEARRISLAYVSAEDVASAGWELPAATTDTVTVLGTLESPLETLQATPAVGGAPRPAFRGQPNTGDVLDVTVDRVEPYGVFVTFEGGRGLVPNAELGTGGRQDVRKSYGVGTKFRAAVVEIRSDGKMRLSRIAVDRAEEAAEAAAYMKGGSSSSGGKGLGTLGDLLKAKLGG